MNLTMVYDDSKLGSKGCYVVTLGSSEVYGRFSIQVWRGGSSFHSKWRDDLRMRDDNSH